MILNFLRNKILTKKPKVLLPNKNYKSKSFNDEILYKIKSFGKKNKNKIFYVIRRSPGAGMFSNINFVIHHLFISEIFNFIPVIDMQNYPNYYNEKNSINKVKNSWEYYFYPISKYNLNDVYKSKNVIICESTTNKNPYITGYLKLPYDEKKYFRKYLKFKKHILNKKFLFIKKNFKNKKILGVHFRGSDQKYGAGHPFPPTVKQIIYNIDKLLNIYDYDKIFLVTEEKAYFNILRKKYGEKICTLNNYRSFKDIFDEYPRKNHRYLLGEEILLNTLLLSETDHILGNDSNVVGSALSLSKQKKLLTNIYNGFNSKNVFFALILWKLKSLLPKYLGGFEIKFFGSKVK